MENNFAKSLLEKYVAGNCTAEECAAVEAWYAQWNDGSAALPEEKLELAMKRVQQRLPTEQDENTAATLVQKEQPKRSFKWNTWAAAAAIVLSTSFGIWFYNNHQTNQDQIAKNTETKDILPGKNTAVLTLPNGKSINLSDAKSGVVIDANQLSYNDGVVVDSSLRGGTTRQSQNSNERLTATTPRGGQYQFTLADGTRVWLNAASTLKFPANFQLATTRSVQLIGEAYFEVAKDKSKPFIVETEQQQVEVLGTHFNINNYADEYDTRTTLIEGSIRLSVGTHQLILKPGQQAILSGTKINLQEVDPEEAIAWKNGIFAFNDEDLESIMRKVARWYDVEVYYQDKLPKTTFLGNLSRSKNLSVLLKTIESSVKVHFKVEGRRVTVMH